MAKIKTNAVRILEQKGVAITIKEYPVDENDLSGEHAASVLGLPSEKVFKTLVLQAETKYFFVCCIPSAGKIDLKKAARVAGKKKVDMIPVKNLKDITGYIRGGCSPVGMKKKFPTFIDETVLLFDEVIVSAGIRGAMIVIRTEDLLTSIEAETADLIV